MMMKKFKNKKKRQLEIQRNIIKMKVHFLVTSRLNMICQNPRDHLKI